MPADPEIKAAEERVRRFLQVAGPSRPDDIVRAMEAHGIDEPGARRALWRMIDSHKVELTPDRKLRLSREVQS